jgi:RimJ/RimL family protein N-acetyltransferase
MAHHGPQNFALPNGQPLVLRHLDAGDGAAFPAFHASIARETTHTLQVAQLPPDPARAAQAYVAAAADPLALHVGAFDGARMVGQLGFRVERPDHPWVRHVGLFGMMVLREFWGMGVGRRLLEIMHEHADANGVLRIEALVRTENERGLRLYTGMGYQLEGTRRGAALIEGVLKDEHWIARLRPVR